MPKCVLCGLDAIGLLGGGGGVTTCPFESSLGDRERPLLSLSDLVSSQAVVIAAVAHNYTSLV